MSLVRFVTAQTTRTKPIKTDDRHTLLPSIVPPAIRKTALWSCFLYKRIFYIGVVYITQFHDDDVIQHCAPTVREHAVIMHSMSFPKVLIICDLSTKRD